MELKSRGFVDVRLAKSYLHLGSQVKHTFRKFPGTRNFLLSPNAAFPETDRNNMKY